LRIWLDEWELVPGRPWQEAIEEILATVLSSAVLVGKDGFGPWEIPEMRVCLSQMVKRKLPVIPVLLPGCPQAPELPLFLGEVTWVDLREGLTEDGLDRLEWGITGKKPRREKKKPSSHTPKLHNLPFLPLGDLFKGRDEELRTLETNLKGPTTATAITQTQAISGLGGIGKTRLAVEYAWRSGDRYDAALFVVAESPEALQSGLASLSRFRLPGMTQSPTHAQEEEVAAVLAWLREHGRWLLILDNVDSEEAAEAVREILPQLQGGQILITSRRRNWPAGIRRQPLDELSLEEATAFLLQRTEGLRTPTKDDPEHARRLAEILDGLPLALEQASAYIAHHQMKLSKYLEVWEKEKESVVNWHDEGQMDYPKPLAATWQTTFRQLSPTAAAILRLTAYLAPDPIPLEMFENGARFVEEGVRLLRKESRRKAQPKPVREGIAELSAYSMITREDETFTVHRMVQEVLRTRILEERRREWIERASQLVNEFSPFDADDVRTWPIWNLLRPHAAVVLRYADEAQIAKPTSRLMSQMYLYLATRGLNAEAEPLIRRSLAIEEVLNPTSSETAIRLNNLAALLQDTNRLAEAEPLMRRVVEIMEANLSPNHPNIATALNNLAQLLRATNRLVEAEPLMRRALKIDEDSLGPDHPDVARDLNNLALLLQITNRLAEAEPLMRRALKINENSFGQGHPQVARALNNLALLLQATNRLAEAEPLMRRAVEIIEASLGSAHPKSQILRRNLELLLTELNPEAPQQA
jgi:tetratricopeptide (TPR) repeat protein